MPTPGALRKLIGGWQVNGITTLLSGFPFTPQIGANRSGDGNTRNPDRPTLNPAFAGVMFPEQQTQWFDPNAFILPSAGTWGSLGRGVFRGSEKGDQLVVVKVVVPKNLDEEDRKLVDQLAKKHPINAREDVKW